MKSIIMDVWRTIVPRPEDKNGALLPMLLGLTVVSGLVDAYSFLEMGHIFVANVTGDVLFIAFGLAGAQGFSALAALITLVVFFVGALLGGRIFTYFGVHRGHLLAIVATVEATFFAVAAGVGATVDGRPVNGDKYTLIVLLALPMGLQNALAFKLAVPGLTTSVVTQAITGISAESPLAGGSGSNMGSRIASTLSLFVGALIGALFIVDVNAWSALLVAAVVLLVVGLSSALLSRANPHWVHKT
jgi:uncharacterized membrane protein YoaK (UPF0700 family)